MTVTVLDRVELVEPTKADVQPCNAFDCEAPAVVLLRARCPQGHQVSDLLCSAHGVYFVRYISKGAACCTEHCPPNRPCSGKATLTDPRLDSIR